MNSDARHAIWERFELLPEGAAWDRSASTVWVADVHLGKGAVYRSLGMPVPSGTTLSNLSKLDALLSRTACAHLVILGDLVHARRALSRELLDRVCAWRRQYASLRITLVQGNHDLRSGPTPPEWEMTTVTEGAMVSAVTCRHEPPPPQGLEPDGFCFAGHVHPSVVLHGPGRDRLRVPCFFVRRRTLVLPAFGDFTGGADIHEAGLGRPTALFALAGQHVVPIRLTDED